MGRKYGVSTVSLVPFSLGKGGFKNSLDIAEELKLDGIQALPMRGWPADKNFYAGHLQEPWDKMILSFEGSWNSGTVFQALKRRFGSKKEGYPTFLDLYLFGRKPLSVLDAMENVFGWQKFITHKFNCGGYRYLLEINPDNIQIQNYVDYKHGLVWDTWHVRENGMPNWEALLSELPPESIKMIHFHPKDKSELSKFLSGEKNELSKMLVCLNGKVSRDCPIIIEIRPAIFFNRKSMIKRLRCVRDAIFDWMG